MNLCVKPSNSNSFIHTGQRCRPASATGEFPQTDVKHEEKKTKNTHIDDKLKTSKDASMCR